MEEEILCMNCNKPMPEDEIGTCVDCYEEMTKELDKLEKEISQLKHKLSDFEKVIQILCESLSRRNNEEK